MVDGRLQFDTSIDNTGFNSGISTLQLAAGNAIGNIAANMITQLSDVVAQVPAQMVSVGSEFEAAVSQVAATMGITSAADEFKTLSDAAKDMGESTKFSASEAAEALNYLALAGYDAEKAVSALPTVLNVAAAGGMDLASASDMITDAMSALGLETSEMADFADKLAVTAQKSNTSVSQLGEAILTVGGTAKSLSGGVTELNTVLGILADNGIKGSEGGTALRNVILALSAPTSTAAEALDSLGVAAFDADGNMRPLQDTFADLNTALSTLTQQEQNEALSDIFNKVDLKSVNALLGTSSERFEELTGYIDTCSGAAEEMAETMDDNLKGDLTIMQSTLEGLGIAAYEKFQTPMRNAVQDVTSCIGDLTERLKDGDLSDSFDKISDGFNDIASAAVKLLADDVIPAVVTGFSEIVEHGSQIISIATGIAAGFAAWKVSTVVLEVVNVVQMANVDLALLAMQSGSAAISQTALAGGLTLAETAAALFSGKITLATAAQAAFNAVCNINPLVLIATGIAAVVTGVVLLTKELGNATKSTNEYIDAMEEVQEQSKEFEKSSETEIALVKRKAERYEELRKKYDSLSQKEKAEFLELAEELQKVLPEGTKVIDEQTGAYQSLEKSIDDVIAKMRIQATLNSRQDAYELAVSQNYDIDEKISELEKLRDTRDTVDPENQMQNLTDSEFMDSLSQKMYGIAYDELIRAKENNDTIIDEYEEIYRSQYEAASGSTVDSAQYLSTAEAQAKETAERISALNMAAAEEAAKAQEEATEKLQAEWKSAEHNYAIGVIASEEELYAEKQRIWNEYGNTDLEEHWQYYEDLIGCQQDYAQQSQQEYEEQLRNEWNAIDHNSSLGLISTEEAYKQKLAFIQKYCPEYSDEWYEYYKDVYDLQQEQSEKQLEELKDSITEQVDVVESGLNEILTSYKSAYSDIQSNIDSYKNKLLSVGDALSVIENEDGSKTLKVNDLREQMAAMQKYHSYIKGLKENGASAGLLSELTSMDFEDGSAFAENLSKLSAEEFDEINDYYNQRDKLAQELADDLYQPEINNLNEQLATDITAQFEELPESIRSAGSAAINAFMDGLQGGNLSEQVETFCDDFITACNEGISNGFDDFNVDFGALLDQDTYGMGKQLGDDFVGGFNAALEEIQATVQTEQSRTSAEYTTVSAQGSETEEKSTEGKSERIVVENHITARLDVDGEKMAEKVIEETEIINRRRGK